MATVRDRRLERRLIEAAEASLDQRGFVTAIDVLIGLGWLPPSGERAWRQGRIPYLERAVSANLSKVSGAMRHFRRWATTRGLKPSETAYVARTRDRRTLRFSKSGKPSIELAYRTHWVSPELSERKRERLAERQSRRPDLVVVSPVREWTCSACGGTGDLLIMDEPGPLCLTCAELDHLVYLPAGDARADAAREGGQPPIRRRGALQPRPQALRAPGSARRGRGLSPRRAAVPGGRGGPRSPARARGRAQSARRRRATDALRSRDLAALPGLPAAARRRHRPPRGSRGSGRIGRSAVGRALEADAVELAVVASIRHQDTAYDELLMTGVARADARDRVRADVDDVPARWRRG